MGAKRSVLVVSSDYSLASFLERELATGFDIHAAATDVAAFALLDSYSYECVVVDLSARSFAGSATVSSLRLSALTIPVVAFVPTGSEIALPESTVTCSNGHDGVRQLAAIIRQTIGFD